MLRASIDGGWRSALLLVIAAAVLRAVFFGGLVLHDDITYIDQAHQLSTGTFDPSRAVREARLGMLVPPAVAFAVFGASEITAVWFPFLCSVLAPLAALWLGHMLFSRRVGMLAGLLLVVFPLELIFASQLYACSIKTLLTSVALIAFLRGEQRTSRRDYFLAGLALGLAGLVHESALICLVFYPLYAIFIHRPIRAHLFAAFGLMLALAVDPPCATDSCRAR